MPAQRQRHGIPATCAASLTPIAGAVGTLVCQHGHGTGQAGFSDEGDVLGQGTQKLTSFPSSSATARLASKTVTTSSAPRLGFAFTQRRHPSWCREATASTVSSYCFNERSATPASQTTPWRSPPVARPAGSRSRRNGKFAFIHHHQQQAVSAWRGRQAEPDRWCRRSFDRARNAGALTRRVARRQKQPRPCWRHAGCRSSRSRSHPGHAHAVGAVGRLPPGSAGLAVN